MRIDIHELLKEVGLSTDIEEELNCSYPKEELILKAPIKLKAHLVNTGQTVLLTGSLDAMVELECVRCLKKFDLALHTELDEEFNKNKVSPGPHGGEMRLTEKDFIFSLEDGHILDLSEVIRQNLILELPMKPLCNEEE